jgi:hypothetical protein
MTIRPEVAQMAVMPGDVVHTFAGVDVRDMTREELLVVVNWCVHEIQRMQEKAEAELARLYRLRA